MSPNPNSEISNLKSEISDIDSHLPAPLPPSSLDRPISSLPQKSEKFWESVGTDRSFNLTELQQLAIEHTLRGVNDSRIAEILGITRRTLWNWKTFNEDYRRALAEGRAALHAAVINQIQATAAKALAAIDDLLDDCDEQTRLRAAQIALRAAAALKPKLPDHQYHSPQSLRVGIIATTPEP